jgi:hypothetical protein
VGSCVIHGPHRYYPRLAQRDGRRGASALSLSVFVKALFLRMRQVIATTSHVRNLRIGVKPSIDGVLVGFCRRTGHRDDRLCRHRRRRQHRHPHSDREAAATTFTPTKPPHEPCAGGFHLKARSANRSYWLARSSSLSFRSPPVGAVAAISRSCAAVPDSARPFAFARLSYWAIIPRGRALRWKSAAIAERTPCGQAKQN